MKSRRLVLVSVASFSTWAFVVACGSGGGYRGAFTDSGRSGAQNSSAGAGAGGAGAGAGGATGGGQGATGGAGSGGIGGAQAGDAGEAAGMTGMGGLSGGGNAGTSGSEAGAGGRAGGGAISGASGVGMTAGSSGAGGAGGAGNGATAGAGKAGNAGTSGAGGAGASGAESGGMAGAGPLRTCAERCNANADCRVLGIDQGYRCNASSHRCERFAEPCRTSIECMPQASFWIFGCNTDQDCFFFSDDLCVDVGGVGRCARLAPSPTGCESPNADEVTLPRFGAAGSALVCANASLTCADGTCVPGCATNTDCTPQRNGSVCDTDTHLCRCARDEDCGGAGVSHCNLATGGCECSNARDCEEVANANVCSAGRCGCSAVTACNGERTFSGTSFVCE